MHSSITEQNFVSHHDEPQVGDAVVNNNPDCKHYESEGVVIKIESLPEDKGKTATYKCTNDGDNWQKGDVLTKTMDQLMPVGGVEDVVAEILESLVSPKMNAEETLRRFIREAITADAAQKKRSEAKVRGYLKPTSCFHTLAQWESVVNQLIKLQEEGVDTRGGKIRSDQRLLAIIDQYFGYLLNDEVTRWEHLTTKNVLDFIEDFANHRFWGLEKEFGHYFPDITRLKFAYFYSRGDIEPYVLLDEEFTTQLYGTTHNPKELLHYTSADGLERLKKSVQAGQLFDISTFTVAERPFFRPESNLVVHMVGNVRAGFRSDIKSMATDSGRRACNLYRLEYPGRDLNNICDELETCDGDVRTSLWNEYIATPIEIIDVYELVKEE